MKCVGCGDFHIVIKSCAPLCEPCAENARGRGEFGDYSDELDLESLSLELLEDGSEPPEAWLVNDLWWTHQRTLETA